MDVSVLLDSLPLYGAAAWLTLRVGVIGVVASLVLGAIVAAFGYFRVPVARQLCAVYIELSRNTPLLVQLFFLYYGLPKAGVSWSAQTCAIVGLTFLGGSYMAEALRSGLEAIDPIQLESAQALGMKKRQALRHVLMPQGIATAMPALTANTIFLIKETSVVSVIALPDLVYRAKEQIGMSYTTTEALFLLVVFYLAILLPIALIARWLERRTRNYAPTGTR